MISGGDIAGHEQSQVRSKFWNSFWHALLGSDWWIHILKKYQDVNSVDSWNTILCFFDVSDLKNTVFGKLGQVDFSKHK